MSKAQPYSEKKMKMLRDYLVRCSEEGKPRYYEIKIDNIKVVPRTNDASLFELYLESIEDDSQTVELSIYQTNERSFNSEKHLFRVSPEKVEESTLSGVEIENKIQSAVEKERERMANEKLRDELAQVKADLKEAEEYIEHQKAELKKYEGKKLHWGNVNLGELASVMVEGMVRRNPQLLTKIPGGEALAGIIEEDNKERENRGEETEDAEVTFIKNTEKQKEFSEDQKRFLQVLEMLEESFDEGELGLITAILSRLMQKKQDLITVAGLLDIPIPTKEQN
jgi:hypothetical protein